MSILSRLFRRSRQPSSPAEISADRPDVHRGFDVSANRDIIAGYRFCATIQLRTPLRVLRRHREFHKGVDRPPPQIAGEMWEGIWLPVTHTWREMGFDMDEQTFTMASDIGLIPDDGGEYLKFLIAVRTAAEGSDDIEQRRAAVVEVLRDPAWRSLVRKLDGPDAILCRLFPPFVSTVPRMPAKVATALIEAGFDSPDAINAATDAQLRNVGGVGPGLLKALRDAAREMPEPSARYADRVIR